MAYFAHLAARGCSPATIRRRRVVLRALSRSCCLLSATTDDLERFLARPLAPASRRAYASDLRSFYGWAHARGLVGRDPSVALGRVRCPPSLPRPLSDVEAGLIWLVAVSPRDRLLVELAGRCGLRCCEMAALRPEDVGGGWLWVHGKGGRMRTVPCPFVVPVDLLPLGSAATISRRGRLLFQRAGVRGGLHRLRHTYATRAYRQRHDLLAVRDLLGHSSVLTTQGYVQTTNAPDHVGRGRYTPLTSL